MMRGEEIQMRKILHGILIALALLGGIAVASGHVETTATTCCIDSVNIIPSGYTKLRIRSSGHS